MPKKRRAPRRGGSRPARRPSGAPGRTRHPGGARARGSVPPSPGVRGAVERRSYPLLVALAGGPKWLLGLAMAALVVAGLAAPAAWGAAALVGCALVVLWLTYLSWPALAGSGRLSRALLLALLLAGAVLRLTERL